MSSKNPIIIPEEFIQQKIYVIRGKKVMIDRDLGELYKLPNKHLNQQVKRNIQRFPDDFMFQLTKEEWESLKSQFVTSKKGRGGIRKLPYAFTEQGVAMLSSVLHSDRAIHVNIQIMRTFVKIKEMMSSHKVLAQKIEELEQKYKKHDEHFVVVFSAIKKLLEEPQKSKSSKIGFHTD